MLPLLALFVLWLALTGRLSVYGELMRTGPGWGGFTGMASRAVGGTGTPNTGSNNPVLNPGHVSPPPGKGPLDWFWGAIGMGGGGATNTAPTTPNPGSGTIN
jgi:hypothetical protein